MGQNVEKYSQETLVDTEKWSKGGPVLLNLGCGKNKIQGWINIDYYGEPDLRWNLNSGYLPFHDNSVDMIAAWHIMEHLDNWWNVFSECARILKPGGMLEIRIPDESSATALTYRDHIHVFSKRSFHGIIGSLPGSNSWADEVEKVPLKMTGYVQVPFKQYNWMTWFPPLLRFCAKHLRNFIWEQRFMFQKVRVENEE